jgi:hypothetical protein
MIAESLRLTQCRFHRLDVTGLSGLYVGIVIGRGIANPESWRVRVARVGVRDPG